MMTGQGISTSHIDRFSSLPNELLDSIFDLAYLRSLDDPSSRIHGPLSKRLLPFYLRILRHTFSPNKWKSVGALNQAILRDPTIAPQVQQVDFVTFSGFAKLEDRAESILLLRHLPDVKEVHFGLEDESEFPQFFWSEVDSNPQPFRNLRSLKIGLLDHISGRPSPITGLAPLRHLRSLTKLTVLWPYDPFVSTYTPILLPNVKQLTIRGDGSADVSCLTLVQSCPSLELLELNGDEADGGLDEVLLGLPPTLQGLSLRGPFAEPIDQSIPHLVGLRLLHLGKNSYGSSLPLHLSSLPLLEDLTLQDIYTKDNAEIIADLVDGPHRLGTLRSLALNLTTRVQVDVRADPEDLEWRGKHPDQAEYGRPRYDEAQIVSIEDSIVKARSRGLEVTGWALDLRLKMEDYLIEKYNRAVLHFLESTKNLEDAARPLVEAVRMADNYSYQLPSFDHGRRLTRSQIVKIPVDEDGRFVLGLKEAAGGTVSSNAWGRRGE